MIAELWDMVKGTVLVCAVTCISISALWCYWELWKCREEWLDEWNGGEDGDL
jgi:hypothetical protein